MNLPTLRCPACGGGLSIFDAKEKFACPKCAVDLQATDRFTVLMFELIAFFFIGAIAAGLYVERYYFAAVLAFSAWCFAEYMVRVKFTTIQVVTDGEKSGDEEGGEKKAG